MSKARGYIIYNGPSLLDGKPIVVIALPHSQNKKTGNMMQTYILRSDIDPVTANKTGEDYSICGHCPLKGTITENPKAKTAKNRGCYVIVWRDPLSVWKAFKNNRYTAIGEPALLRQLGQDKKIRVGSYGDPAAVPFTIWESLISQAKLYNAYSHQSGIQTADFHPEAYMYSADSEAEARDAWAKGVRTFRTIDHVDEVITEEEILCPGSKEGGRVTTCSNCGLCGGSSVAAKNIAMVMHGSTKKYRSEKAVKMPS